MLLMKEDDPAAARPLETISYASASAAKPSGGLFLLEPIGGGMVAFVVLLVLLSFAAASGPAASCFTTLICLLGWTAATAWWGMKAIARLSVRSDLRFSRRQRCMFFITPVLLGMTLLSIQFDLPSKLAFRLARSQMQRIAVAQLIAPDGSASVHSVGVYGACEFSHSGNTVTITVPGGFMDKYGFAYCPAGKPNAYGVMHPLGGPWYDWWMKF
jgi:hypothetical protein